MYFMRQDIIIFNLVVVLLLAGCGVKGAPMPRRDEAFIRPSELTKKEAVNVKQDTETEKNKLIRKKEIR